MNHTSKLRDGAVVREMVQKKYHAAALTVLYGPGAAWCGPSGGE